MGRCVVWVSVYSMGRCVVYMGREGCSMGTTVGV